MGPDQVRMAQNDEEPKTMEESYDHLEASCAKAKQDLDPWKHRSERMRCMTCMWFVGKIAVGRPDLTVGRCRKNAPTMNGYPVVFMNDWCGSHKIDETKL